MSKDKNKKVEILKENSVESDKNNKDEKEEVKKSINKLSIYNIKKYVEKFCDNKNQYIKDMLVFKYKGLFKKDYEWKELIDKELKRRIS